MRVQSAHHLTRSALKPAPSTATNLRRADGLCNHMLWINADNAAEHLRRFGYVGTDEQVTVEELSGGVSNVVLLVRFPSGSRSPWVLKQARPQLRTPQPWYCGVERIWREIDVLRACYRVVDPGQVPEVQFVEWENYLFGMNAAPADSRPWKHDLLAGRIEPERAAASGRLLGRIHSATWLDRDLARQMHDRRFFHQLRLDPYYGAVARAHPQAARRLEALSRSLLENARCLVHADFTPKNLLVHEQGMMLVDYETGHFGDPAFDLGLMLAHLVLKAFYHCPNHEPLLRLTQRFWQAYEPAVRPKAGEAQYEKLIERSIQNFAGCCWARIDGTSRVDYLDDPKRREAVRRLCWYLLRHPQSDWTDVLAICRDRMSTF